MHNRIKELRKALNLTQAAFAEKIGVRQNTVAIYEGGNVPKDTVIRLICREFNVSEKWLRTGEGEMVCPQDREAEIAQFVGSLFWDETPDYKMRLISILTRLDDRGWMVLEKIVDALTQEKED